MPERYEFHLSISPERYLEYYRGTVKQVVVRSTHGVTVQFPASLLVPFVLASGIQGRFELTCDEGHRGAELRRLSP
ncbi:MAG TPA: DUF2835 family protein [Holophagaceae bacterium]|nr:DUF2835 family protein [Geothrix sp.]HJW33149.1 DUF2835 family protein [Holophagaceae bacterium]